MDYSDKYTIKTIEVPGEFTGNLKSFTYQEITITELFGIGHLRFTDPLVVDVFSGDDEDQVLVAFDFGMDVEIPVKAESNICPRAYPNEEDGTLSIALSTIKFDLMHAFFHYSGDPNYGHLHWALFGNLKDRVVADDEYRDHDNQSGE